MKLKILSIVSALVLSACAQAMSGLVDSELYWKDCRPYKFPSSLTVITPQSPGSTAMPAEAAPKRALVKRGECGGSWQVVDLIPAKPDGAAPAPAATATSSAKYELRDVAPPFAVK
jgi:hypothetical protein